MHHQKIMDMHRQLFYQGFDDSHDEDPLYINIHRQVVMTLNSGLTLVVLLQDSTASPDDCMKPFYGIHWTVLPLDIVLKSLLHSHISIKSLLRFIVKIFCKEIYFLLFYYIFCTIPTTRKWVLIGFYNNHLQASIPYNNFTPDENICLRKVTQSSINCVFQIKMQSRLTFT